MTETVAPWIYMIVLLWCIFCLGYGHHRRKINLWDCVTTTKVDQLTKEAKTFTDPKKLAYIGAFVVMSVTFAYWGLIDRLSEWYALLYATTWVAGKALGDREQRLQAASRGNEQTDRGAAPAKP